MMIHEAHNGSMDEQNKFHTLPKRKNKSFSYIMLIWFEIIFFESEHIFIKYYIFNYKGGLKPVDTL